MTTKTEFKRIILGKRKIQLEIEQLEKQPSKNKKLIEQKTKELTNYK
jgi:hypothetical protein